MSTSLATSTQNQRNPFLAWRFPDGMIKATESQLEDASFSCERWEWVCAAFVAAAVFAEMALAIVHPSYDSIFERIGSAFANAVIAFGIIGEVFFSNRDSKIQTELRTRSNKELSEAIKAHSELEAKLWPRMLSEEQWNFIQGLRGKFDAVAIAYEVDVETRYFATTIRDAFFSAGIKVAMYPRDADVHSFGILIFDPKGFDGAHTRTAGPLIEIFSMSELVGSLAVITSLPTDVGVSVMNMRAEMRVPLDTPTIIVGGRFVIPPPHLEKAAKMAEATRDSMSAAPKELSI